jgi:hypothetical protein
MTGKLIRRKLPSLRRGKMRNEHSIRPFSPVHLAPDMENEDMEKKFIRKLKELCSRLHKQNEFKEGDLVKWKPGLKNRNYPAYGEPVIIVSVLDSPVFDPSELTAASPYFREPLSLIIGEVVEKDFVEYHVDARRFELFRDQRTPE